MDEETKRYKDALEYYADKTHYTWGAPHKRDNSKDWDMGEVARLALHPDNYDTLIPDEYKNGQLSIAGVPVYVCYSTPDNTVLLGYATKEDAVKMAHILSVMIESFLNGAK